MSGPFQGGTEAARVVVALVSYEAREALLSTLDSLSHLELPAEVVVVDNASTDGSSEAVRARHPRARLIANPENVGFATACNQGFRASAAPLVLFLNPDAELEPGAVLRLARVLDERPDVGLVGPRIRFPDGTIQVSTGPDLSPLAELWLRRLVLGCRRRESWALERAETIHGREHEPDWISGACILARRTALEALSGFDERFFLYEEDADLCRRARAAGWKVVFTPAAQVRHRLGQSMARARDESAIEYHRSHLLYYRLHSGLAARIVLRTLLAARGLAGWAGAVVRGDGPGRRVGARLLALAVRNQ